MKVVCWLVALSILAAMSVGCGSPKHDEAVSLSDALASTDHQSTHVGPDLPEVLYSQSAGCLNFSGGPAIFQPTAIDTERSLNLTLTSCDFDGNRILSATILPEDSPFALKDPSGAWDPATEEWVVPAWQQEMLQVIFQPTVPSPVVDGSVEPYTATLHLEYRFENGPADALASEDILLSGQAVPDNCITAIANPQKQMESPLAVRLDGLSSISPAGPVTGYEWQVLGPDGATQVFHPSVHAATIVFATDIAGPYKFDLAVTDDAGTPQCFSPPVTVDLDGVVFEPSPPATTMGLEVLLHWRTPGDWHYEEGDTVSNVDLHLVHDWAGGPDLDDDGLPDGWFDTPYDCWAGNPGPHWGVNEPGSTDDPDFFGDGVPQGPEQILLPTPEDLAYRIGIHYRDDFGLGPIFARVIVYFHGEVVMESPEALLWELDLWEVGTVEWPEQSVTPVTTDSGDFKILNDYSNPYEQ